MTEWAQAGECSLRLLSPPGLTVIEILQDGSWRRVQQTEFEGAYLGVKGLEPGTAYIFRYKIDAKDTEWQYGGCATSIKGAGENLCTAKENLGLSLSWPPLNVNNKTGGSNEELPDVSVDYCLQVRVEREGVKPYEKFLSLGKKTHYYFLFGSLNELIQQGQEEENALREDEIEKLNEQQLQKQGVLKYTISIKARLSLLGYEKFEPEPVAIYPDIVYLKNPPAPCDVQGSSRELRFSWRQHMLVQLCNLLGGKTSETCSCWLELHQDEKQNERAAKRPSRPCLSVEPLRQTFGFTQLVENDSAVVLSSLLPGQWYWVSFGCSNESGSNSRSESIAVRTPVDGPEPPHKLQVSYTMYNDEERAARHVFVKLRWSCPRPGNVDEFIVQRLLDDKSRIPKSDYGTRIEPRHREQWVTMCRTKSTECILSALVTLRAFDCRHIFIVKARNESGWGASKPISVHFRVKASSCLRKRHNLMIPISNAPCSPSLGHADWLPKDAQKQRLLEKTKQLVNDYLDSDLAVVAQRLDDGSGSNKLVTRIQINKRAAILSGGKAKSPRKPKTEKNATSPRKQRLINVPWENHQKGVPAKCPAKPLVPSPGPALINAPERFACQEWPEMNGLRINDNSPYRRPIYDHRQIERKLTAQVCRELGIPDQTKPRSALQEIRIQKQLRLGRLVWANEMLQGRTQEFQADYKEQRVLVQRPTKAIHSKGMLYSSESAKDLSGADATRRAQNLKKSNSELIVTNFDNGYGDDEQASNAPNKITCAGPLLPTDDESIKAATKIQSTFRMKKEHASFQVRLKNKRLEAEQASAALKIQCGIRRRQSVNKIERIRREKVEIEIAATRIQAQFRALDARRKSMALHMKREQFKREKDAALKIQQRVIAHRQRTEFKKMQRAASVIQTNYRGHFDKLQQQNKREACATTIQTQYRGHKARKAINVRRRFQVKSITNILVSGCGQREANGMYETMSVSESAQYVMTPPMSNDSYIIDRSIGENKLPVWTLKLIRGSQGDAILLYANTSEGASIAPPRSSWQAVSGLKPAPSISWQSSSSYMQQLETADKEAVVVTDSGCPELHGHYYQSGVSDNVPQYVYRKSDTTSYIIMRTPYGDSRIWILAGSISLGDSEEESAKKIYYVNIDDGSDDVPPIRGWVVAQHGVEPEPIFVKQSKLTKQGSSMLF